MKLALNLKPSSNSMASFYPISTNENSNDFNWDIITSLFVSELYGLEYSEKKLVKFEKELINFKDECKAEFDSILSDYKAWDLIDEIYFIKYNAAKISPKLRLYSLINNVDNISAEKRIVLLLKTLFQKDYTYKNDINNLNFIENKINNIFEKNFPTGFPNIVGDISYLPKLSKIFSEDLKFLVHNPKYFLENIQLFLELYMFLYTAQLSIVINSWKEACAPEIKDCYFILDTERASKERSSLQRGYKLVEKGLESIFPTLALTESLQSSKDQKLPLWQLVTQLSEIDHDELLKYCNDFAEDRELNLSTNYFESYIDILSELQQLFKAQFDKGQSRSRAGLTVVNTIKHKVLKPFTQTRGSAGTIFVLNQEYLLLLTNLVIGEKDKLRLYEVIKELELRGIFFDKESRKALVEFYERLGNVEKMSDSGDAIYVKKTI